MARQTRDAPAPSASGRNAARDAVGHADHGERAVGEMRQDEGRHLREVAQQVALGERRLLQRRIRGPVDAVEVVRWIRCGPTASVKAVFRVLELRHDLVDLPRRVSRSRSRRDARRARRAAPLFGSTSSRSRRNTGARSDPSSVQLWNLTSATASGSTQVVGASAPAFRRTGRSSASAAPAAPSPARACGSSNPEPTCDA